MTQVSMSSRKKTLVVYIFHNFAHDFMNLCCQKVTSIAVRLPFRWRLRQRLGLGTHLTVIYIHRVDSESIEHF